MSEDANKTASPAAAAADDDSNSSSSKPDPPVAAEGDSTSASNSIPTPSQQDTDSLLTDSENTNNENRVIEMESGTHSEVTAGDDVAEEPDARMDAEPEKSETSDKGDEDSESVPDQDKYAKHVTYDDKGEAIYTDPESKHQYKWSKEKNEWVPVIPTEASGDGESNPYENEHYRWCEESNKWIPKENPKETEHYRWCDKTNQWIPKEQPTEEDRTYSYIDGVHHYTDKDGAIYFWDEEKKAWFPKVDDEFMAVYQLRYGFYDNTSDTSAKPATSSTKEIEEPEPDANDEQDEQTKGQGKKRKAPPEPPKWFDLKPEHNTKVYVSNLPLDTTEEEFGELMSKCGMILKDAKTNKLKLKLYRDSNGMLKGDGLCHYIKIESVELALSILDNYDVRGHKIHVQQAEFQLKGEYNPSLKPKVKKKKDKEKMRKMQEALFDWRPEKMRGERSKHERIVIVKNLFEPELFEREVHLLLEYQNDLREECNKCGTCRRVVVFDRHQEGVAQVTMSDPEEADLVVKLLHGRFFGKRKLTAEIWDGRTKYRIAETEADVSKRLDNWEKYLEKEEAEAESKKLQENAETQSTELSKAEPAARDDEDSEEALAELEKEEQLEEPEKEEKLEEAKKEETAEQEHEAILEQEEQKKQEEDDDPEVEKSEPSTADDKTGEEPVAEETN